MSQDPRDVHAAAVASSLCWLKTLDFCRLGANTETPNLSWTKTPSEVVNHRGLGRVTPPSDNQGAAR